MRVPGRKATWSVLAAMLVLATGAGIASVVTSPAGRSTAETAPTTPVPPTASNTTMPSITTSPLSTTNAPTPVLGVAAVAFLNGSDGYGLFSEDTGGASCSLSVASTHDGGVTFSARVLLPPTAQCFPTPSLSFDNVGDGFVSGPGLVVTHDGGLTWSAISTPGTVLSVIPLGRSVWMVQRRCPGSGPSAICHLDVEQSTDGGRSWRGQILTGVPIAQPYGADVNTWLLRLSVSSALVILPTGGSSEGSTTNDVLVLSTTTGGRSWEQLARAPCISGGAWVERLSEASDGSLWLACASEPGAGNQVKTYARSLDGGRTWLQGPCPLVATSSNWPSCLTANGFTGGYLGDIAAVSATTALIDGGRNIVQITNDGGKTWGPVESQFGGDANGSAGLFFANERDGWAIWETYGAGGPLWHTTDGGEQWSQVWPSTNPSSGLVPALQTHNPTVTVSPSTNLTNGEQVSVRVTGFGIGGKVWLSECATADVNDLGCGNQLPAQTLLVTDNTGSGSMAFAVRSSAAPKPLRMPRPTYNLALIAACWWRPWVVDMASLMPDSTSVGVDSRQYAVAGLFVPRRQWPHDRAG